MTDEQRALRDAFLAECWKPVPEWHPTGNETARIVARNEALAVSRDEAEQQIAGAA